MANIFVNLPLPVLNGPGAAVNVSAMGIPKTVVVDGTFEGATITIEASVDGGVVFAPVETFQSGEMKKVSLFAAQFARVNVSGRKASVPFTANIDMGANDAGALFAAIPMPALNGPGVAVNVSAFGSFSTFIAGGSFVGARILVEVSEDGVGWAPLVQFSGQGGQNSKVVTADFVRANVSGRKASVPFTGTLAVGAVNDASSLVVSDPGNSSCLIYQPGGGQTGPGTFASWTALMAQLASYRANANGGGCYTIMFDDSIVSPAVIPAGGPYDMTDVVWSGDDTGLGAYVEIADGATFLRLVSFRHNITVRNKNTVTPAVVLADLDIVRISDFSNLETLGGAAFFDGTAVGAGGSIFVIMTESSNLGYYVPGPVFSMPTAGSILIVLCDDLSTPIAGAPGPFAGGVGAILRIETPTLNNIPTVNAAAYPGWAGTFNVPVITAAPSFLPTPYLAAPGTSDVALAFNDWARLDPAGDSVAVTLPTINGATGQFKHPGCLVLVSEMGGSAQQGAELTVVPAAGDTFQNGATTIQVAAFGSVLFIGDGVSAWTVAAVYGNQRFSPPEQWTQQNVAASQTDVALSAQVSTNFDNIKMIRDGSLVGLSTRLTQAITAGTLTVTVTLNGGGTSLLLAHTAGSNPSGGQVTQRPGLATFIAGDLIGIKLTTTAGFLPITTDLGAWLELEEAP